VVISPGAEEEETWKDLKAWGYDGQLQKKKESAGLDPAVGEITASVEKTSIESTDA
jgi:uncharacterized protein (UPF0128 family)